MNVQAGVIFHTKPRPTRKFFLFLNTFLVFSIVFLGTLLIQRMLYHPVMKLSVAAPIPVTKPIKKTPVKKVEAIMSMKVPILLYHYVEHVTDMRDTQRISMNIPPDVFEKQVQTLLEDKYTFLTMAELQSIVLQQQKGPQKPVVLTFDDGYLDFYEVVYPILQKYHIKAVVYVVPGFLNKPNYMHDAQVQEISQSRLVEVASHTQTHISLVGLPEKQLTSELEESKQQLAQLTGKPVVSFAYPYGFHDTIAMRAVAAAGYTNAVSTQPGNEVVSDALFSIPRVRPGMRVGLPLLHYIAGNAIYSY